MEPLLEKSPAERRIFIQEAAARTGKTSVVIEKDFWVCWLLGELFALPSLGDNLTFKGGTSLSKVYQAINRFSEDIDLAIHRDYLGFGGEADPEAGASNKETRRRLEALADACAETVRGTILQRLQERVVQAGVGDAQAVTVSANDPQTLLFRYPRSSGTASGYIQPQVKMEFGARSDDWPLESATVMSYLEETFREQLGVQARAVIVLKAERTFWEKATILHAEHHRPLDKAIIDRLSRHYYDLHCLAQHPVAKQALQQPDLLARVAQHKSVFFRSGWARYEEAVPGSLRLLPRDERVSALERDYRAMHDMFFHEPPAFDAVLTRLSALESQINGS